MILPNFSGNTVMRFKKSQGSTWDMREDSAMSNGTTRTIARPYLEVERTDDHITLFSGPWDYGSNLGGKHGANTVIFSLNNGMVNVGPAIQQTWEGTMTSAGEPKNTSNGWRSSGTSQNIDRVMMAEPDNVLALTFTPDCMDPARGSRWCRAVGRIEE